MSTPRPAAVLLLALAACGAPAPPEDADLDLRRAENAVAQGRFDWARLHYERDFAAHPDRLDSLREAGLAWLSGYQQSISRGAAALERYLEARPDDQETRRRLVSALLLLGERRRAVQWAAGLDADPAAELLRAEVWLDRDPAAARDALERTLAASPDSGRAHALLARLAERDGDLGAALAHAEQAVRLQPLDAESFYLLGRVWRRQGERERALEALAAHQLLGRLKHDGTLAPLAPAEELTVLDELGQRLPAISFAVERRRLTALFRAGRLAEALDLLARLGSDPRVTTADLREMAVEAGEAGRRGAARQLFERVVAVAPGDPGATASLALLDLDEGDLASARRRLEAGLAERPDFARYHLLLGRVARAEDDAEEARRHFERAVDLAPWESAWRADFADLLTALGEADAARRVREGEPVWHEEPEAGRVE